MLEQEFAYYIEHQEELVEKYDGKVIVLQGTEVLGVYDTVADAYWWAYENSLLGKVLIQTVGPGESNYTLIIQRNFLFE